MIEPQFAPVAHRTSGRPTVSVVIATRDRLELLRKAVSAVMSQTYQGQVECVVVFDGTEPDSSIERELEDRIVRVITNGRTAGLAGARNAGALASSGELIAFCDDDDAWYPDKLEAQVDVLTRTGHDVVVAGIEVNYRDRSVERVPRAADMNLQTVAARRIMAAHPSTVLVRRTAFEGAIGLVDEEIPGSYGEDFDWMLRALQHGPVDVVERPLVRVLWGSQSFFAHRWQSIVDAIDYGLAKHPILSASSAGLARLYGRKAFALGALGRRREAARWAVRAARLDWRERRAYLALLVASGVVRAEWLLRLANSRGRGI